ncbi:MAG TPA: hypothetical protein VLT45_16625 [Kofleriaceae bacterium]|nr:hypothetical protein [Kofleriaceae bacterium]
MRTLVFAVLVGCGGAGGHPAPQRPVERPAHAEPKPPMVIATETSVTDCHRLFEHVVALDDHAHKLLSVEQAEVIDQLESELQRECLTKPRAVVLCGIDAPTSDAIAACDQRMPSSSTSNSSVAPPGITPPAPRSP